MQNTEVKDLHAIKTSNHETLTIHNQNFDAVINMNIAEYGHIFHDCINAIKKIIEIQANNKQAFKRLFPDITTSINESISTQANNILSPSPRATNYELDYNFIDQTDVQKMLHHRRQIRIK